MAPSLAICDNNGLRTQGRNRFKNVIVKKNILDLIALAVNSFDFTVLIVIQNEISNFQIAGFNSVAFFFFFMLKFSQSFDFFFMSTSSIEQTLKVSSDKGVLMSLLKQYNYLVDWDGLNKNDNPLKKWNNQKLLEQKNEA